MPDALDSENTISGSDAAQQREEPGTEDAAEGSAAAADSAAALDIGSQSEEPKVRIPTIIRGRVESDGTAIGTGRRKTAVARVRLKKGVGKIVINSRAFEDYFPVERQRLVIQAPLSATGLLGQVDIRVLANGGGLNGQAGAIVLGIARAIQALHPEQHGALSDGGFLTRDDRMVERKKYGHKKARRSFQFSKR